VSYSNGIYMSNLLYIRLGSPTGRLVSLRELRISATENYWPGAGRITREQRIREIVASQFNARPLLLRLPNHSWLPPLTCIALFESNAILPQIEQNMPHRYSELVICWFTSQTGSIRQIACEGVAEVDWEAHARDVDLEW
jgi:hypothetical protein